MKTTFLRDILSVKTALLKMVLLPLNIICYGQDPVLPPTNLGLTNIYDGFAGKPGFVYVNYTQAYGTHQINDASGNDLHTDLKINSLLSLHQIIYLTSVKLLGGNLGFTVVVPIVNINATSESQQSPNVNPSMIGDILQGTSIQWSGKKLFGKAFSHRVEFDISFPTGSYHQKYAINPSSHLYNFGVYHAFTLFLTDKVTVSSRNQFNYNSKILGKLDKPGAFYNGNYAVEFEVIKNLHLQAAAYYLSQLNEDSYDGDPNYYKTHYQIVNTKQSVLGYGPGVAYFGKGGLLIEGKMFFETGARNTTQGIRPTLHIVIPF